MLGKWFRTPEEELPIITLRSIDIFLGACSVLAFASLAVSGCSSNDSMVPPGSGASGGASSGGDTSGGGSGGNVGIGGASTNVGGTQETGGAEAGDSGGASSGGSEPGAGGASTGGADGSGGTPGAGGSSGDGVNCDGLDGLTTGDEERSLDHDGETRSFIFHVPPGYDGSSALPLVIDFHGLGGSGSQQRQSSGFASLADSENFFVIWPSGIGGAWNMGQCCTDGDVDDVGFARALVEDVAAMACIDPARIYAAGFSNGGGMSNTLACEAADLFAAVAPSAFDLLVDPEQECNPSEPISVLSLRGTNDTVVPYAGGPGSGGRVSFAGATQTLARWAMIQGCEGEPEVNGDLQLYTSCNDGVEVGLFTIQGGGHAPGGAAEAWSFLSTKSK